MTESENKRSYKGKRDWREETSGNGEVWQFYEEMPYDSPSRLYSMQDWYPHKE